MGAVMTTIYAEDLQPGDDAGWTIALGRWRERTGARSGPAPVLAKERLQQPPNKLVSGITDQTRELNLRYRPLAGCELGWVFEIRALIEGCRGARCGGSAVGDVVLVVGRI